MIFMTDSHGSIHVATYLLEGPDWCMARLAPLAKYWGWALLPLQDRRPWT